MAAAAPVAAAAWPTSLTMRRLPTPRTCLWNMSDGCSDSTICLDDRDDDFAIAMDDGGSLTPAAAWHAHQQSIDWNAVRVVQSDKKREGGREGERERERGVGLSLCGSRMFSKRLAIALGRPKKKNLATTTYGVCRWE